MGDQVDPGVYTKLSSMIDQETTVEVESVHWDGKCTAASVKIVDDSLRKLCQNEFPHITLALRGKTEARYSNDLLAAADHQKFVLPKPL